MTKELTLILVLATQISFAQYKPQPTPFDKFVNKPGIEWAAYGSDTINFTSIDLNNLLLKRIINNEIKASKPVESRTAETATITYSPLDSIDQAFYGDRIDILMDSTGTQYFLKRDVPEKDSSNFKGTEVTQILYIEKGKLKSYIPFITPTLPVYMMPSGRYIGERFYFTSCFNYTYNSKPRNKSKLIFLTQTKKMISVIKTQKTDQLKELYGQNVVETLWPHVLNNELDVFAIKDNRKLKPEESDISLAINEPVLIPVYDSVGSVISYVVSAKPIDMKSFTAVQLLQDWHYDRKRNKVYSNIKEMILFVKKDDHEAVPVLRFVFR
ncbi:MAG: hypothetical protein IPL54_03345 [Chitinophagaceae bacterium]|nr:hypothetical protein [Chitinophagaceae bacterium]